MFKSEFVYSVGVRPYSFSFVRVVVGYIGFFGVLCSDLPHFTVWVLFSFVRVVVVYIGGIWVIRT